MLVAALIVAAGSGKRARHGAAPKQYALLAGTPMLVHAVRPFLANSRTGIVQVVIAAEDEPQYRTAIAPLDDGLSPPITGGETRQASVLRGLEALEARSPRAVLIHDAARPFVTSDVIDRVIDALEHHPGAIAADPLSDTLKREGADGRVAATIDRAGLWRAQTPQGFDYRTIFAAHRRAAEAGLAHFTDDAAIAEWAGIEVAMVPGSPRNMKITTVEDIALADRLLAPSAAMETRTGNGFDVHRFGPGDHVWLCGVRVPHDHGLLGHSDADVALHALTDALLGAIGDGDIGEHFPPSDPRWKGAPSHIFLADAARRIAARGGRIGNVDITLLCEEPKIAPYRAPMRESVARVLALDAGRVSVKATTTETLGFVGRREGIAAMATATVLLPP